MKHQVTYLPKEDLDLEATLENLKFMALVKLDAGRKPQPEAGNYRFMLGTIKVLLSPTKPHRIQVAWTDDKEKIEKLEILKKLLVSQDGREGVDLHPLRQNIYSIPHDPLPEEIKLNWCEERTQYFSFDRYSRIMNDEAEMTLDYTSRLDFEAGQRRADLLYSSDVLPQSWKKRLEPFFKDPVLKKAWKAEWLRLFLVELRKLIRENSK
jgi:hypothetical protein